MFFQESERSKVVLQRQDCSFAIGSITVSTLIENEYRNKFQQRLAYMPIPITVAISAVFTK